MTIRNYTIPSLDKLAKNAYSELYRHEQERSENKCIWGFFPDLEEDEDCKYPHCLELKKLLDGNFRSVKGLDGKLDLSFIKMASGKPPVEFGDLHLDTKAHSADPESGEHILRLILNLGQYPRVLKYTELNAEQLCANGVKVIKGEYHPIELPPDIPVRTIQIPKRECDTVSGLLFWASEIPHVGVTDEHGYFIAGYRGCFDETKLQ